MIYATVRLYATAAQAGKAFAVLEDNGLTREDNHINLVAPAAGVAPESLLAAILSGLVPRADALVYAQSIKAGHSLVSVVAPFGWGREVEDLLDELDPLPSPIVVPEGPPAWDDAAPFSSAFGFPVLSTNRYQFMGLPSILRKGRTTSAVLGFPELASSHFSIFGDPKISNNPGPFSGLFRLPLLRR